MTVAKALKVAKVILKQYDMTIIHNEYDEYVVNMRGGKEATAYYTNDIGDAVATGVLMAAHRSTAR